MNAQTSNVITAPFAVIVDTARNVVALFTPYTYSATELATYNDSVTSGKITIRNGSLRGSLPKQFAVTNDAKRKARKLGHRIIAAVIATKSCQPLKPSDMKVNLPDTRPSNPYADSVDTVSHCFAIPPSSGVTLAELASVIATAATAATSTVPPVIPASVPTVPADKPLIVPTPSKSQLKAAARSARKAAGKPAATGKPQRAASPRS